MRSFSNYYRVSCLYAPMPGLDKLDTLAMNHNQLTRLDAGDFEGLPRLTSLSLDYNKISYIDREAFRGLEGRTVAPVAI